MYFYLLSCFFLFFLLLSSSHAQEISVGVPTTPHIHEIFLGKCYMHNPAGVNCTGLWEAFSDAAMLDPRFLSNADYDDFFEIADFSTPIDGALFWSGTKGFAQRLANPVTNLTTLEETPTGYILDDLSWCGRENVTVPEFNYASPCPFEGNSSYYAMYRVWTQASAKLAQAASGRISVLLTPTLNWNTTDQYASFRNTTIFASIEFPNLNVTKVTGVRILLLVTNSTFAPQERCGSGSVYSLQQMVVGKFGFEADCIDDQNVMIDILCPNAKSDQDVSECMSVLLAEMAWQEDHSNSSSSSSSSSSSFSSSYASTSVGPSHLQKYYLPWSIAATGAAVISIVALIAVSVAYSRLKRKDNDWDREAAKSLLYAHNYHQFNSPSSGRLDRSVG